MGVGFTQQIKAVVKEHRIHHHIGPVTTLFQFWQDHLIELLTGGVP